MEPTKGSEGALDERIRNLILNNAPSRGPESAAGDHQTLSRGSPGTPPKSPQTPGKLHGVEGKPAFSSGKTGRKRPNQAQRRQMSAQLSIPIDPRPQPPYSARSYASPPGYPEQQYTPGGQPRGQRPHSATFRPPSGYNNIPGPPATGVSSYPSQPRHHQSLSYNGPIPFPGDRFDWRPPQSHLPPFSAGSPQYPPPFDAQPAGYARNGGPALWQPPRPSPFRPEDLQAQDLFLEGLCNDIITNAEIETAEIAEKEAFRSRIEQVCRDAISQHEREQNGQLAFPGESVQLRCFGSLSSGFATKASDMDLGLLSPLSAAQADAPGSPIPRIVEKAFLDAGLGARLLTRTRVPIIKVCEKPPEKLMHDLLDERLKWENGLHDDPDAADEDQNEDSIPSPMGETHVADKKKHGHRTRGSTSCQDSPGYYKYRLTTLKQSDKKSTAGYYSTAKKTLRKIGGRDLANSNIADFTAKDYKTLNDVSLAFVRGLADDELRGRLESYQSLSTYNLSTPSNHRTLLGVYTQVEGEKLVMAWASRPLREKDDYQEKQAEKCVKFWRDLQNKPSFGIDPLGYTRELQHAAEQLRKIPSLQMTLLQQGQYESASLYYSRATKLLMELGGRDKPAPTNKILPVAIRQYIAGIYSDDIRQEVEAFVKSERVKTLNAVARRQKSLQLSHEFSRALEKGLYNESLKADILAYIEVLQSPMRWTAAPDGHFDYVIPMTPETQPLIARIQQLTNPFKAAPNQPRDPYRDRLEFPKSGVGVQCDINFSAHLALQNTLLLRCYSHTDPRVRPLILFVKHWAKTRKINSPYRGTLSSYGYVLMMLHYLVNIAHPFVCPNLQQLARPADPSLASQQAEETITCKGRNVQFWRDEAEIQRLARNNVLNRNRDSIGHLLRGFFEYYAQTNVMSTIQSRGFDWGRDVLSLRTHGGLLSKQAKGWTGAKTVVEVDTSAAPPGSVPSPPGTGTGALPAEPAGTPGEVPAPTATMAAEEPHSPHAGITITSSDQAAREVKEVRHRYLFAIEDPFELDHNVARTVTHNGIVAIRDEFRRAWRIIKNAGKGEGGQENLLQDVATADLDKERAQFIELLDEIHGVSTHRMQ